MYNKINKFSLLGDKYQPFLAFSIQTNAMKVFSCTKSTTSSNQIECLNGIRIISAMYVVVGHTAYMYEYLPVQNRMDVIEECFYNNFFMQII